MKLFHISDVLSVTTGHLVSSRGMEGVYDILNFLTGDDLYTHQLPRAMRECEPWLRTQFPRLMRDDPLTAAVLKALDAAIQETPRDGHAAVVARFVEFIRDKQKFPEQVPVYEMGADMHTHIDPAEEAKAMRGDENVIVVHSDAIDQERDASTPKDGL